MSQDDYSDAFLRDILLTVKTIAMVGASDKETRPSYRVFGFLLARGYHVIGVNPGLAGKSAHGAAFFRTLANVPGPINMVDIFRNSAAAGGVVDEALALNPRPWVIWMQLGVRDEAAAARARALGVKVVMNRCPKIEYERLAIGKASSDVLLTRLRKRLRVRDGQPQNDHGKGLMQKPGPQRNL
jgi:predicted CoA-binding protein